MKAVLGIDTSCYTTSAALVAASGRIIASSRRLLTVEAGERGLMQSEGLFQHVKNLPDMISDVMRRAPQADIVAVSASTRPRPAQESYMPVFRAGESQARAAAALLRVPFYPVSHQEGHVRAHTMAEILSKLNSPLGIYAIYGNHDFLYDIETVRDTIGEIGENMKERFKGARTRDALGRARIELLANSNVRVHTPDGDFYVAGIADPISMSYSYSAAFKDIPEGYPVLFLTHTPGVLREIPKRAAISFAGHTHGGQIVIPRFGPISNNCVLPRRYAEGLYEMDGKMIYTTRGLGQSRIPFRFNCPPRITFVTIRSDWSDMEP